MTCRQPRHTAKHMPPTVPIEMTKIRRTLLSHAIATVEGDWGDRIMTERQPGKQRSDISPKDVFERSNMPSWWERLTGVSPKIAEDRMYLSFVAARYLGEERLCPPGALAVPIEVHQKRTADFVGSWAGAGAVILAVIGLASGHPVVFGIASVGLILSLAFVGFVSTTTSVAIKDFEALKSRCDAAHARIHGDTLDSKYGLALQAMITHDEGTLAYCAAKIASEIQRQDAADPATVDVISIDLWDELEQIATSAREIAEDREETEELKQSRLRSERTVQETIDSDQQLRQEALGLLAARVSAFADYRDRLELLRTASRREHRITSRAMRLAADEVAVEKPR